MKNISQKGTKETKAENPASFSSRPSVQEINVVFLGSPTYAHHGPQAALIQCALAQDALRKVYKKLPPGARKNMLLTKRWGLWAVLATEEWAYENGRRTKAPKVEGVSEEVGK